MGEFSSSSNTLQKKKKKKKKKKKHDKIKKYELHFWHFSPNWRLCPRSPGGMPITTRMSRRHGAENSNHEQTGMLHLSLLTRGKAYGAQEEMPATTRLP